MPPCPQSENKSFPFAILCTKMTLAVMANVVFYAA